MTKIGWTEKLAKEWRKYKPPSRPSYSEVRIYEYYIKKLPKDSKILLLGSTPEIRDIAAKYKMNVMICDWSEEIYEALKLLMSKNNPLETFSKQDWRSMHFNGKFDIVIGDAATTVVPYKDLDDVLNNISKNLKPDGVALQRIWVRYKDRIHSLQDIVKIFNKKPKNIHWYTWILFPVFLHYYYADKESLSGEEIYKNMIEDYKNGRIPKRLVELFSLVKNHKTPNNVLLKKDLERKLKKYFRIIKIEYGKDNFKRNAPIYILKKK